MIAMLAYIIADVSRTSRMSSLGHLGSLLYYFEAATEAVRTLEKASISPIYTLDQMESFALTLDNILDEIDIIRDSIRNDFELWTYCKASKIIEDPIIPVWNFDNGKPTIGYDNLYNVISRIIATGKQLISMVPLKKSFTTHTKFIYLNGLSYAFDYTNHTTHEIVNCEIDRVKTTGENIQILIAVGLIILGILALIIFTFILSVSKSHDGFWNFILNNAQLGMLKLKNSSIDRLMLIHGTDCNAETNGDNLKNPHSIRKAHSSLHLSYAWRILAFFIIAASYYFLVYFYIYQDCEEMMKKRPVLLNNFNLRRVLLSRLSIFSREAYLPYMNILFKDSYAFPNPQEMVENTYAELMIKTKEIRNKKLFNLMSQELIDKIYENTESDTNALEQGSYPLENDVIDEIYSLKNTKFITTIEHTRYNEKITTIQDEILNEFLLADHDSKNIINSQLNIIIETTIFYSLAVLLLFFFYYWPFFIAQENKLNKFSVLQNIIILESE